MSTFYEIKRSTFRIFTLSDKKGPLVKKFCQHEIPLLEFLH